MTSYAKKLLNLNDPIIINQTFKKHTFLFIPKYLSLQRTEDTTEKK